MFIHYYTKYIVVLFGLFAIYNCTYSQNKLKDTYPVPNKTDKLLFYLQRTHNKNAIIYELNTQSDGTLNQKEPVRPYWIRYTETGNKAELSYIQKKLAFGINAELLDKQTGNYKLTIVSYKARTILLQKYQVNNKNKYRALVFINGKVAELQSIFVNTIPDYFSVFEVTSVELFGNDLKTGKEVYEKIIP